MKDAAFSDGIFSNIVVLRNQAPHSDRQNTDLADCVQTAMYQRSICFQHPLRKAVALCGKHIGHGLRNRVIGISPQPGSPPAPYRSIIIILTVIAVSGAA